MARTPKDTAADSAPSLPQIGDPAPAFTLTDATGAQVSLADFTGRKVILFCYPAAGTPGCTREACEFSAADDQLDAAGYEVLGLSPDSPAKLEAFARDHNLAMTLLSDPDRSVLAAYGAFGEKKNYGKTVLGVIRSTFLIDEQGRIEQAWRNVKATGHVARVLKAVGLDG